MKKLTQPEPTAPRSIPRYATLIRSTKNAPTSTGRRVSLPLQQLGCPPPLILSLSKEDPWLCTPASRRVRLCYRFLRRVPRFHLPVKGDYVKNRGKVPPEPSGARGAQGIRKSVAATVLLNSLGSQRHSWEVKVLRTRLDAQTPGAPTSAKRPVSPSSGEGVSGVPDLRQPPEVDRDGRLGGSPPTAPRARSTRTSPGCPRASFQPRSPGPATEAG